MKIGYCVNMLDPSGGCGWEWIHEVMRAGFDYVELPLAQMTALSKASFQENIAGVMDAAGAVCLCCNNFFPASCRLTGPDASLSSALAYADRAMDCAARLNAKKIVFGSSGARNRPEGFPKEQAMDQLADLLRSLSDMAQCRDIDLVLEPLNRMESNLLNRLSECAAFSRSLGLPRVNVLADTFHMSLSGEGPDDLAQAQGRLRHVHLARTLNRSLPCPGDEENWPQWFASLKNVDYDDTLSIEAHAALAHGSSDLADALRYLKSAM